MMKYNWVCLRFMILVVGGGGLWPSKGVSGIGVNWGTQSTHPLPPYTVVGMLQDNWFSKAKLFDANSTILDALGKSGVQVVVGIPNDMLSTLAGSIQAAENWVAKNLPSYISSGRVNIRYVAVGNEPFLNLYFAVHLSCNARGDFIFSLYSSGLLGNVSAGR